ncbi:NAD-dependent epimerase/dehydratase family protein [Poriferisphaera sp. WC338]|uniref:NAD-dependent epimerase/dehydratase family protein n=1 Tax=Poriferisphaera sp. WC338 TaxID=3425129 RepID=UPI003D8164E2
MKVLVTGGTGFTGLHLVRHLLKEGHEVTSLDLHDGKEAQALREQGANMVTGSITNKDDVEKVVTGQDLVFHLASAFREIFASEEFYREVDVEGTRNVLDACLRHNIPRVVHTSTQGVHGHTDKVPQDESAPFGPLDLYCKAKLEAESVCKEYIEKGLPLVILRPSSIYGPGVTFGFLKIFKMIRDGKFFMVGSGNTHNHPVYIDNLIQALMLASHVKEAVGQTYIIGDERYVTLNELTAAMAKAQGIEPKFKRFPFYTPLYLVAWAVESVCRPLKIDPPIFRRRLAWFRTNRGWSIEKAKRELGYKPAIDIEEGCRRSVEWYRAEGLL